MARQGEGGNPPMIYAMVARGTVVVAEHTAYTGNFRDIAAQCLHKLPAADRRFAYACDGHTFTFLLHQGYAYCVVAAESAGRELPLAFLERIKEEFNKWTRSGKYFLTDVVDSAWWTSTRMSAMASVSVNYDADQIFFNLQHIHIRADRGGTGSEGRACYCGRLPRP